MEKVRVFIVMVMVHDNEIFAASKSLCHTVDACERTKVEVLIQGWSP